MTGVFSHLVRLDEIAVRPRRIELEADAEARAGIAKRLGVPSVERLAGTVSLRRLSDGVALQGALEAALTRICVASLDSMDEVIADSFDIRFGQAETPDEATLDLDLDAPEPLPAEGLDLGEILIQQLALAMAAYPRKDGAPSLAEAYGRAAPASPFAGLGEAFTAKRNKE
ncbi:MAG: DUF177 domain-containing protein [Amphiplicatus sp.]